MRFSRRQGGDSRGARPIALPRSGARSPRSRASCRGRRLPLDRAVGDGNAEASHLGAATGPGGSVSLHGVEGLRRRGEEAVLSRTATSRGRIASHESSKRAAPLCQVGLRRGGQEATRRIGRVGVAHRAPGGGGDGVSTIGGPSALQARSRCVPCGGTARRLMVAWPSNIACRSGNLHVLTKLAGGLIDWPGAVIRLWVCWGGEAGKHARKWWTLGLSYHACISQCTQQKSAGSYR